MRELSWYCRQLEHVARSAAVARRAGPVPAARLLSGRRRTEGDGSVTCHVDRFRSFEGTVHVAGRVRSTGPEVVGVGLRVPGRRWGWVEAPVSPMPSDDGASWWQFAFRSPGPAGPAALDWTLRAALADGSWVELPGAPMQGLGGTPFAAIVGHWLAGLAERPPGTVVEVGGRDRSGHGTYRRLVPADWKYVAFDIIEGPNVDVVGDAHALSEHFEAGSVDAIVSASVFEHLAMPWKVALEMNRVLRPGGTVLTTTHQSWPMHEVPWDFWRFSDTAWTALFNEATGFRVVEAAMGEPADLVPLLMNGATGGLPGHPAYLGSAAIAAKTGETALSWPVPTEVATRGTYPA